MTMSDKEKILSYAQTKYQTFPDQPWKNFDHIVLRHQKNRKWYALLMTVEKRHLGMAEEGMISIMNVKSDPFLLGDLRRGRGIYPAYHMNKEHWITVVLDGTVEEEKLYTLLDFSYRLTQ